MCPDINFGKLRRGVARDAHFQRHHELALLNPCPMPHTRQNTSKAIAIQSAKITALPPNEAASS